MDIACRNTLLTLNHVAKIADFGLVSPSPPCCSMGLSPSLLPLPFPFAHGARRGRWTLRGQCTCPRPTATWPSCPSAGSPLKVPSNHLSLWRPLLMNRVHPENLFGEERRVGPRRGVLGNLFVCPCSSTIHSYTLARPRFIRMSLLVLGSFVRPRFIRMSLLVHDSFVCPCSSTIRMSLLVHDSFVCPCSSTVHSYVLARPRFILMSLLVHGSFVCPCSSTVHLYALARPRFIPSLAA